MADKIYIATLTQTSTNAPVATELVNSLGALVWTRTGSGVYVGTLASAFSPVASSSILIPTMTNIVSAVVTSINAVTITASGDAVLTAREVDIIVQTHYCTFTDIERKISRTMMAQLTNDTANATIGDAVVLDSILTDVDTLIDSKCGILYTVPFTTVPDLIKDIATDLACFKAMQRRPVNMEIPKAWTEINKDAMQQLQDIGEGKVNLPTTATLATTVADFTNAETTPLVDFNDTDNGMYEY
jgi:phage gp36-like protein